MKVSNLISLVILSFWMSLAEAAQPDIFKSPTVGFEVTKPTSWHYLTAAQNLENIKATKLTNQELQAAMLKYATAPLVAMTKFPEPYSDVNPSFKVNIKPYGQLKGQSSTTIIGLLLPQFQKMFRDYQLDQSPMEVEVSGIKSGYARINYTLQTAEGLSFPTTSELWLVPHGDYFLILGGGTRRDEKTGSRKEITAIVRSVKVER